ncbi:hypothetical protein [Endozoicomonas lisbonensis]|uniref:hypothetical protein n=1 Tax=Endozoicomonas lisbonensis TaxID=3120522 RepID=UPI003397F77E
MGTTVDQFNFYTQPRGDARVHELDRRLTFILDNYIPGGPQRVTAYNQRGQESFDLPESLADSFPNLPDSYRNYYGDSENSYRMAALLLLVYYARFFRVEPNTFAIRSGLVDTGAMFNFTSRALSFDFQVDIQLGSGRNAASVAVYNAKKGGKKFGKNYFVKLATYAPPHASKKKYPMNSATCRPHYKAPPSRDDDDDDNDSRKEPSCCGCSFPGVLLKHLRNPLTTPDERSGLIQ